jgi:Cu2+-exporting ATPase
MLRATEVAVAVLVVTCPCALGIATPLAYELAQARLRRRGLFVRTPSFFDRALALRKILLDKTGTVTLSQLVLSGNEALLRAGSAASRRAVSDGGAIESSGQSGPAHGAPERQSAGVCPDLYSRCVVTPSFGSRPARV